MARARKPAPKPAPREGYDVGLHGDSREGSVDVGVSVDPQPQDVLAVGLYVNAPRVGQLVVGLSIEAGGATQVASLTRSDGSGASIAHTLKDPAKEAKLLQLEQ